MVCVCVPESQRASVNTCCTIAGGAILGTTNNTTPLLVAGYLENHRERERDVLRVVLLATRVLGTGEADHNLADVVDRHRVVERVVAWHRPRRNGAKPDRRKVLVETEVPRLLITA